MDKKIYATISADIVESTSLSVVGLRELTQAVSLFISRLEELNLVSWGRLVKGDFVECLLEDPGRVLRVALMLKSFVKGFCPSDGILGEKFKRFGVRLAIGIGGMRIIDRESGIMDGEAIYLSGRALSRLSGESDGIIQFVAESQWEESAEQVIFSLLIHMLNKGTGRQCETLYHRLQCRNEDEVAQKMGISRPAVNQAMRALGWEAIGQALEYFEKREW